MCWSEHTASLFMKSEAWSKGLVHPVQCIARQINGNHHERSHHRDTVASNQRKYDKAMQITPEGGVGQHTGMKIKKNSEEKKCISFEKSNWSPKMTCAYLIVQRDRKYLLQGYRSPATHLEDSSKSIVTPRCLVNMLMTNGERHCQSLEAIHNHPEWSRQFGNLKWAV